jgi:hypothetical protein
MIYYGTGKLVSYEASSKLLPNFERWPCEQMDGHDKTRRGFLNIFLKHT